MPTPTKIGKIYLQFQGEPKAIQSVRFANFGGHVQKYQPKQNVDWKNWIRLQAQSQLPREFQIFTEEAQIRVSFLFGPPKSWSKSKLALMASGTRIGKVTKPDLVDNLMKGLCDSLTGIVWRDDSIITRVESEKRYSPAPGITLDVEGA